MRHVLARHGFSQVEWQRGQACSVCGNTFSGRLDRVVCYSRAGDAAGNVYCYSCALAEIRRETGRKPSAYSLRADGAEAAAHAAREAMKARLAARDAAYEAAFGKGHGRTYGAFKAQRDGHELDPIAPSEYGGSREIFVGGKIAPVDADGERDRRKEASANAILDATGGRESFRRETLAEERAGREGRQQKRRTGKAKGARRDAR